MNKYVEARAKDIIERMTDLSLFLAKEKGIRGFTIIVPKGKLLGIAADLDLGARHLCSILSSDQVHLDGMIIHTVGGEIIIKEQI